MHQIETITENYYQLDCKLWRPVITNFSATELLHPRLKNHYTRWMEKLVRIRGLRSFLWEECPRNFRNYSHEVLVWLNMTASILHEQGHINRYTMWWGNKIRGLYQRQRTTGDQISWELVELFLFRKKLNNLLSNTKIVSTKNLHTGDII